MATPMSHHYVSRGSAPTTPKDQLPITPKQPVTPRTPGGTGVSADVAFVGNRFPNYRFSSHGESDEEEEMLGAMTPSKREIISKELQDLLIQQKKLSVRDLAHKFEKGQSAAQAAAAAMADNMKIHDSAVIGESLLTTVRERLEDIHGRVAGRNLEDIEEALDAVEALAAQWTLREGDFAQEKAEVRKMAALFKQASDDSRKMVEEARAIANEEIEIARNAARRVAELLEDQEHENENEAKRKKSKEREELEALKKEVMEARRIKMLHQPTKAMDMEYEIDGLKKQLKAKTEELIRIRKESEVRSLRLNGRAPVYKLEGPESLGGTLYILPVAATGALPPAECTIQWYRMRPDGSNKEIIAGAVRAQYAPEPSDVGRLLQASVFHPDVTQPEWVQTTAPVDPAPGLESYVEALAKKGGAEFNVVIVQQNDEDVEKRSAHVLDIGKDRIKLRKGRRIQAREHYTLHMQLCGARGGGDAAAQGMFWLARKGLSFMLAHESERERNAAIMLARRFAIDQNILLGGPEDRLGNHHVA